nr:MAG TPA: hypothetical protein [Caudoviricetes sp.]
MCSRNIYCHKNLLMIKTIIINNKLLIIYCL